MLLVIDHYDSFTFNIVQYLRELGCAVVVEQSVDLTAQSVSELQPAGVVLAPGPGRPDNVPNTVDIVRALGQRLPMFGVCLGMQCIAHAFGHSVSRGPEPVHGKVHTLRHEGAGVFRGLPATFEIARYHSLIVDEPLAACLEPTAWIESPGHARVLMGLRHRTWPLEGVQFHPESVASEHGHWLFARFALRAGMDLRPLPSIAPRTLPTLGA